MIPEWENWEQEDVESSMSLSLTTKVRTEMVSLAHWPQQKWGLLH